MGSKLKVGLTFYDEHGENVLVESKFDSVLEIIPENKSDLLSNPDEAFLEEVSDVISMMISTDIKSKIREMLEKLIKGKQNE